jgi:predicted ribosome quality control (RQC) complex YloA/Tae2 family protein
MEPHVLQAVLEELRGAITGRTLTKLESLGRFRVLARFEGFRKPVLLSANPALPRVGWIDQLPLFETPRPAPDALAGPLDRARLAAIDQEEDGCVVRFRFERPDDRHSFPVLIAEIIPRFANLILLGDEERILWSLREFQGEGRAREIRAGVRYTAPATGSRGRGRETQPAWDPSTSGSANQALDQRYRPLEEEDARERLRADVRRALVRRREKAAKALHHIECRIVAAQEEPLLRRRAELLVANLSRVRKGMTSFTVPDFDGERDIVIPLDPKLDARGNSEELFRQARRLARGLTELEDQRKIQREEIESADRDIERFSSLKEDRDLLALAEKVVPREIESAKLQAAKKPAAPPQSAFRRYVLPGGWEVWVGRSAKQNDELTHRLAAPRDLWFHARGAQGSHTVLRISSGKGEPPKAIVQAAAAIAAHHSKARNSKLVPVAFTEKRYVRKPRGAPVGTASIQREKVIFVEPRLPAGAASD